VFSWGRGAGGRLGHAQCTDEILPRRITTAAFDRLNDPVTAVFCGDYATAGITRSGLVFAWGLLPGKTQKKSIPTPTPTLLRPPLLDKTNNLFSNPPAAVSSNASYHPLLIGALTPAKAMPHPAVRNVNLRPRATQVALSSSQLAIVSDAGQCWLQGRSLDGMPRDI
jgi:hypothetical protein